MTTLPTAQVQDALDKVMKNDPNQFSQQNKVELETLLDFCLKEIDENTDKLLATLFIKALKNHVGPVGIDEHIYLKKFEEPQIKLFDLIIKHFPFVNLGQKITNSLIADAMISTNKAVLIDVGIGRGIQTVSLLNEIHQRKDIDIEEITVIGIEPFKEAIYETQRSIKTIASTLNIKVDFFGIDTFAENIGSRDLSKYFPDTDFDLFINASLALHHIQSPSQRDVFIAEMAKLKPKAFLLTEPNVNNLESNLYKRFQNSYEHFSHVFQVIDELNIKRKEKNALKLFFGREIEDIIGKHNGERFECHDKAENWVSRLQKAGFKINKHFPYPVIKNNSSIRLEHSDKGFLGFNHKSETVLSIIYAYI